MTVFVLIFAFIATFVVGSLSGYVVARRRKIFKVDVTLQTLDEVLKLDRALYHENDWLRHQHKESPHIGIWMYRDEQGLVHVDNREHGHTKDDNREHGATAAEALFTLRTRLLNRSVDRRASLLRAEGDEKG